MSAFAARWMNLGSRERAGLLAALVFGVAVAGDHLVVKPVLRQFDAQRAALATAAGNLNYNLSLLQQEERVSEEFRKISGLFQRAGTPAEAIDRLKGDIDDAARASGVSLVSMEHREPRATGFLEEYTVEISRYEASIESLLDFLHRVQKAPGMLRVARLTMDAPENSQWIRGSVVITKVMLPGEA